MTLTTNWFRAIDGTNALAAIVRYSLHGFVRAATPADAGLIAVEERAPVRNFPDQSHSATSKALLARLDGPARALPATLPRGSLGSETLVPFRNPLLPEMATATSLWI